MKTPMESFYIAWTIGTKDVVDALKNKSSMSNIIIMIAMVVFLYWMSEIRPFDTYVDVVVYDESASLDIESVTLSDGVEYSFREASSLQEMKQKMAYQNLGLVIPADLDQTLASGGTPTLSGTIFWVDRKNVSELEAKYTKAFGEIIGQPVQVVIDQNVIIPPADTDGMQANVAEQMIYFVFMTALLLIPHLILEEKRTKTLDALLTSPANPGQVVMGKALAGLFYILVIGGMAMILFSLYIVHWPLAVVAFLGYALLAIGLGLAVGSYTRSPVQSYLWTLLLALFLVVPPIFYMESALKDGIRTILTWFPTSALASLFRFACSTGVTTGQLLSNLAIAIVSVGIVFGLVIWKVRRSDR